MHYKGLIFDKPSLDDSPSIYNLIKNSKPLDLNSRYAYMLLASHFRETSIVLKNQDQVVGFISGYLLPEKSDTLFIWQVAVDTSLRGKGIALSLLESLLKREALSKVKFVLTTVSPSNVASKRVFEKLAHKLDTKITNQARFSKVLFEEEAHEDEIFYCIGPIL